MGELLGFGQTVSSLTINRVNIDFNQVGYVVLLDNRVLTKQVAYFDQFGYVEMTQEDVIKSGKQASTCYLMLVARLNTDPRGNVYGDDITVEYMRMSSRQYNSLIAGFQAVPNATALQIRKDKNVNAQGKDVSSVSYQPAMLQLSSAILQRIEMLQAKPEVITSLFAQVDSLTGVPYAKYEEWLKAKAGVSQEALPAGAPPQQALPPMPNTPPAQVIRGESMYPPTPADSVGQPSYGAMSQQPTAPAPYVPQQVQQAPPAYPAQPTPQVQQAPPAYSAQPTPQVQQAPAFGQSPAMQGFDQDFGQSFDGSFGDGGI